MFSTGFLPDVQSFPDWFRRTPAGREMLAAQAAELLERRKQLVKEIEAIDADGASLMPALDSVCTAAREKVEKARAALARATQEFAAAQRDRDNNSARIERERGERLTELHRTADPAIEVFLRNLRDAASSARHATTTVSGATAGKQYFDGQGRFTDTLAAQWDANRPVNELLNLIRAAHSEVEAMRFRAIDDTASALNAIRQRLQEAAAAAKVVLPLF